LNSMIHSVRGLFLWRTQISWLCPE